MKLLSSAMLLAIMVTAVGCSFGMRDTTVYSPSTYQGDGTMSDRGDRASFDRFVLDLGDVDLSKQSKVTYKMSKLPPVRMNLGLKMTDMPPLTPMSDSGKEYNKAQVKVSLKTDGGKTVFEHDQPLSKWTWSGTVHGTYRVVYVRDFSPGTSFTPTENESYVLTLDITPDPTSKGGKPTSLRITGGGWKVSN